MNVLQLALPHSALPHPKVCCLGGAAPRPRAPVAALACAAWLALALAPISPARAQSQDAARVQVSGFQVSGNTLLEARELDAVLLPLLGTRSLAELQRAAAEVQALYARAGYGAVVAFVPPQTGQGGTITIQVVEGKISQVTVTGQARSTPEQVRASVPALQTGQTPHLRRIDAQLRMANENPARQVQVLIKPGERTGEAVAELAVTEQPLQRVTLGLDNTGNARTGQWRASATWQHASLTGHDDVATAQLQTSPTDPGQVRVASGGYRWPLYGPRLMIDTFAAYSDVDGGTTQTVAGDLRFNGRGRVLGARLSAYLPRWGDADQRLTLGLDRRAYLNRCDIEGLGTGACGPAGESVAVTPISLEYALQASGDVPWGAQLSLQHNLRAGGAHTDAASFEAVRPGARPAYTAWRLGLNAAWSITDDWLLRGRLNAQFTGDALVSGEQFGLGGAQSVRGYEERELVGDRGLAATLELLGPPVLLGGATGTLRPVGFVDGGAASNVGDAPCVDVRSRCSVLSAGLGARYARGPLQARLDLAYPFKTAARTQRGDARAHLSVQLGF